MNSLKEFPLLDQTIFEDIKNNIYSDNQEYQDSTVYLVQDKTTILDKNIRSSTFKKIKNETLFNLISQYLNKINSIDKEVNYYLIKDDITIIKYVENDFFEEHEDYIKLYSNEIEQCTFLLCIDANCEGGETIFKINEHFKYFSKNSITPGCSIIFRKDFTHAGNKIISGQKIVLSANIWSYPKSRISTTIIAFCSKKIYVVPTKKLKISSTLSNLVSNGEIFIDNFEAEDFFIIYDILVGKYIDIDKWKECEDIIKYFNINIENTIFGKLKKQSIGFIDFQDFSNDVILYNDINSFKYAYDYIKSNKLPYVSFKIIYLSNSEEYNRIYKIEKPCWCSFTDYNHVLFSNCSYNVNNNINNENILSNEYYCENIDDDEYYEKYRYFKLGIFSQKLEDDELIPYISQYDINENEPELISYDTFDKTLDNIDNTCEVTDYYCLDENKSSFLITEQIDKIIEKIKEVNFLNVIKEEIYNNYAGVEFKQIRDTFAYHCNEETYQSNVLIIVNGLLKL